MTARNKFMIMKIAEMCGVGWVATTYVLFLTGEGLSLKQTGFVNAIFMSSGFTFDIPTGYLGDRFGHRRIYLLGMAVFAIATLVYGFSFKFSEFVFAEILAALGAALMSEALEAWLRRAIPVERYLTKEQRMAVFHQYRSRSGSYARAISIIPAFLGSIMGERFGFRQPWYFAAGTLLTGVAVGILILRNGPDTHEVDASEAIEPLKEIFEGVRGFLRIRPLRLAALTIFVRSFATQPYNMFWSVILEELGADGLLRGYFWIGVALSISAGGFIAGRLRVIDRRGVGLWTVLIGMSMFVGSSMVTLSEGATAVWVLVCGFFVHEVARGGHHEVLSTYQNLFIGEDLIATQNSAVRGFGTLGSFVGLLVFGVMTDYMHPLVTWVISSVVLVVYGTTVYFYRKR